MSSAESLSVPSVFEAGAYQAAQAFQTLNHTLVAAHVGLDGDALGSLAGVGWLLQQKGCRFALFSETGIPRNLQFVTLPGPLYSNLAELPFVPESAIYLDCSEPFRLGEQLAKAYRNWPSVNIDHHITDSGLGSLYNYIQPSASATAQLVAYVAMAMHARLSEQLVTALALGIVTDTGGFCHGNTTAAVLELSAWLIRNGCDLAQLREKLDANWSIERLRLWGDLLSNVRLALGKRLALSIISLDELHSYNCSGEDLEGLVEWLRKIRGVKVAATLREVAADQWKFSLRSIGGVDVRSMAASLGGGGHKNAAGGTISLLRKEAETTLISAIDALMS